jgi:NTP pyrophosphatase (non-canonical NTP hydrolase)
MFFKKLSPSIYGVYRGDRQLYIGTMRECLLFSLGYGTDTGAELRYVKRGRQMKLKDIASECYKIARERADKKQAPNPDNTILMFKHLAGEVIEATNAYNLIEVTDACNLGEQDFFEELSDVIIDTLIIAESCRINIYDAIQKKIKKNKERANLTDI